MSIHDLSPEILELIFQSLRVEPEIVPSYDGGNYGPILDHPLSACSNPRVGHLKASRAAILSATLVCRTWREPAQRVLWKSVCVSSVRVLRAIVYSGLLGRYTIKSLAIHCSGLCPNDGSDYGFEWLLYRANDSTRMDLYALLFSLTSLENLFIEVPVQAVMELGRISTLSTIKRLCIKISQNHMDLDWQMVPFENRSGVFAADLEVCQVLDKVSCDNISLPVFISAFSPLSFDNLVWLNLQGGETTTTKQLADSLPPLTNLKRLSIADWALEGTLGAIQSDQICRVDLTFYHDDHETLNETLDYLFDLTPNLTHLQLDFYCPDLVEDVLTYTSEMLLAKKLGKLVFLGVSDQWGDGWLRESEYALSYELDKICAAQQITFEPRILRDSESDMSED